MLYKKTRNGQKTSSVSSGGQHGDSQPSLLSRSLSRWLLGSGSSFKLSTNRRKIARAVALYYMTVVAQQEYHKVQKRYATALLRLNPAERKKFYERVMPDMMKGDR